MKASNGTRDIGGVKDEVPDLTKEDIGGSELKGCADVTVSRVNKRDEWYFYHREILTAAVQVRVRVDQSNAAVGLEVGAALDDRHGGGIANELGVVVVDDVGSDEVGAGREVDDSRGRGGSVAEGTATATVAGADGVVDGDGVVSDAVSLGAIVLNIAEDLVGFVGVEGGDTLVLDLLHPIGRTGD